MNWAISILCLLVLLALPLALAAGYHRNRWRAAELIAKFVALALIGLSFFPPFQGWSRFGSDACLIAGFAAFLAALVFAWIAARER